MKIMASSLQVETFSVASPHRGDYYVNFEVPMAVTVL
jgi:hypothetical protein